VDSPSAFDLVTHLAEVDAVGRSQDGPYVASRGREDKGLCDFLGIDAESLGLSGRCLRPGMRQQLVVDARLVEDARHILLRHFASFPPVILGLGKGASLASGLSRAAERLGSPAAPAAGAATHRAP